MVGMSSGLKYTPGAFQGQCYQIVTLYHVMYQAWLVFRSASARNETKVLSSIRFGDKKTFQQVCLNILRASVITPKASEL